MSSAIAPTSSGHEWLARWGSDQPPDEGQAFEVGRLSGRLLRGELVDLRVDNVQILRRICVRVRDLDWNSVEGVHAPPVIIHGPNGVSATFTNHHRDPEAGIDFEWSGQIEASGDDVLEWTMSGRASRAFDYARIGICLLLNPEPCIGRRYRARRGECEVSGRIRELISPQPVRNGRIFPMFDAFTELELELAGGGLMRCTFEGDLFEMEDQRNWSDGSLKIYSSPVGDPLPRCARAGEEIVQRVRIAFSHQGAASGACGRRANRSTPRGSASRGSAARSSSDASPVELTLTESDGAVLPPIGLGLDHDRHEPTPGELAWLRRLAPAHLRVDVSASDPAAAVETLRRADQVASALTAELEVALTLRINQALDGPLRKALGELSAPVARIIVLDGAVVTGAAHANRVRRVLPGVRIATGTDAYFAECNRDRPDLVGVDGFAFPLTPQVHDSDEQALVESLGAQAATVQTAHAFANGRPIHTSPVTLKPRWNPLGDRVAPDPGGLPAGADPRQPTTFAAAWTIGSIHQLAAAGAASLTFYELTSWRGVIDREGRSVRTHRDAGRPLEPFPLFWVLAEAARLRGRGCLGAEPSDPLSVEALAVRDAEGFLLLVANLRPEPVRVRVASPAAGRVEARPLDARGCGWGEPDFLPARRGVFELDLAPWSVTRVAESPPERR